LNRSSGECLLILHSLPGYGLIQALLTLFEKKMVCLLCFWKGCFGLLLGSFDIFAFHILVNIIVQDPIAVDDQV
jgi:hypothetical protein